MEDDDLQSLLRQVKLHPAAGSVYESYSLSSFDGKEVLIVVFVGRLPHREGVRRPAGRDPGGLSPPAVQLVASATGDLLAGREVRLPETQPFGCAIVC